MAYGLTDTSKRQYQHTFNAWRDYCAVTRIMPHDLSAGNVIGFLTSADLARKTKMARLTHLRRLAQTLHTAAVNNPLLRQNHEQLQLLKLPKDDTGGVTRERKALKPDEVFEALRFWPQNTSLGIRNRALLAVLFYAGLRRSEAVALKWADLDLEAGLLTVRHGKGNKERTIPFASDKALDMLKWWRACIPDYGHVFVAVVKGDRIGPDQPIATETIRRICKASGDFKPHDARRTLLTNLLTSGTPLPDAQFIAGHAQGATTIHYAIIKDATDVKGRVKLNY
jgi:integrase